MRNKNRYIETELGVYQYLGVIYEHFQGLLGVLAHWAGYMARINVPTTTNHTDMFPQYQIYFIR